MTDLTLEQQRDLAMWMFPRAWAAAERLTGWRRRRRLRTLRLKAAPCLQVAWLKHQGETCASCRYMLPGDGHSVLGPVCQLKSDTGWVKTSADHICHQWDKRS